MFDKDSNSEPSSPKKRSLFSKKNSLRRLFVRASTTTRRSFTRLLRSDSSSGSFEIKRNPTQDGNRKGRRLSKDEAYIESLCGGGGRNPQEEILTADSISPAELRKRRRTQRLAKARSQGNLMTSQDEHRGTDRDSHSIASSASMIRHRPSRSSLLIRQEPQQRGSVASAVPLGCGSSIGSTIVISDAVLAVQALEAVSPPLRLGSHVPDFSCDTTQGYWESFLGWKGNQWAILCSHPADFTPVCTTEIVDLVEKFDKLKAMDCKVAVLSVDPLHHHSEWSRDILALCSKAESIPFPIIADPRREIASDYGMIDFFESDPKAMPVTIRSVFFINPANKLALSLNYPVSVGRNIDEVIRCVDALQLSAKRSIATPAGWPLNDIKFPVEGDSADFHGCVFLSPSLSPAEALAKYPRYQVCPVPSGKQYLRLVKVEDVLSPTASAEDKSRDEVKKWPSHLRVIRCRVFVSDPPQEVAAAEWKFGKKQPKIVMDLFNWYLTLRDSKLIEVGLVIGGAVFTQIKYLSSVIGLFVVASAIGFVLFFLITSRKKRAKYFNGLFVHFFMELSLDDGRFCVLERTAAGLSLHAGKVKREGMTETLVWENATVKEHVRLAQIKFFCQRHRNDDFHPVFSNGKLLVFNFLSKILQDQRYSSYDEFLTAMVAAYSQSSMNKRTSMASGMILRRSSSKL